jgi:hypothetical protein
MTGFNWALRNTSSANELIEHGKPRELPSELGMARTTHITHAHD